MCSCKQYPTTCSSCLGRIRWLRLSLWVATLALYLVPTSTRQLCTCPLWSGVIRVTASRRHVSHVWRSDWINMTCQFNKLWTSRRRTPRPVLPRRAARYHNQIIFHRYARVLLLDSRTRVCVCVCRRREWWTGDACLVTWLRLMSVITSHGDSKWDNLSLTRRKLLNIDVSPFSQFYCVLLLSYLLWPVSRGSNYRRLTASLI